MLSISDTSYAPHQILLSSFPCLLCLCHCAADLLSLGPGRPTTYGWTYLPLSQPGPHLDCHQVTRLTSFTPWISGFSLYSPTRIKGHTREHVACWETNNGTILHNLKVWGKVTPGVVNLDQWEMGGSHNDGFPFSFCLPRTNLSEVSLYSDWRYSVWTHRHTYCLFRLFGHHLASLPIFLCLPSLFLSLLLP